MTPSFPDPRAGKYSPDELELFAHGPDWWSMADNPPCTSWCTTEHDPNDFRVGGSFACRRTIGLQGVAVCYFRVGDDQVPFKVVDGSPAWSIDFDARVEALTPDLAERLAQDLLEAAHFCRREAQQ